jgi:phospholipase/lecithinase/hemolysin
MRRSVNLLALLVATVVLLSACGSGNASEPNSGATENTGGDPVDTVLESKPEVSCTAYSQETPDQAREGDHIIGATEDYSVTIIVYNDFSCTNCLTIAQTLGNALELYPDDIRLIFRNFPVLGGNDNAVVAAKAAEAAGRQGMFWEMHNIFFATQNEWKDMDQEAFSDFIWEQVVVLGLEPEQFDVDVNSDRPTTQRGIEPGHRAAHHDGQWNANAPILDHGRRFLHLDGYVDGPLWAAPSGPAVF